MAGTSFGVALEVLKAGRSVTRGARDGQVDGIFLVRGSKFAVSRAPLSDFFPHGTEIEYHPHIDMRRGNEVAVWQPSHEDILANDWRVA